MQNKSGDGIREKWNDRHRMAEGAGRPARVLLENLHLLPACGDALDLACGRGANALLLAEKSRLRVHAWDISDVAIDRLNAAARHHGVTIDARVRDVSLSPPEPESMDVIVVAHFLDRTLSPALAAALRPGGLLFYQTFTCVAASPAGPSNPVMRLQDNELLALFRSLRVRVYREEACLGDVAQGWRNLALLVAEKQ